MSSSFRPKSTPVPHTLWGKKPPFFSAVRSQPVFAKIIIGSSVGGFTLFMHAQAMVLMFDAGGEDGSFRWLVLPAGFFFVKYKNLTMLLDLRPLAQTYPSSPTPGT